MPQAPIKKASGELGVIAPVSPVHLIVALLPPTYKIGITGGGNEFLLRILMVGLQLRWTRWGPFRCSE